MATRSSARLRAAKATISPIPAKVQKSFAKHPDNVNKPRNRRGRKQVPIVEVADSITKEQENLHENGSNNNKTKGRNDAVADEDNDPTDRTSSIFRQTYTPPPPPSSLLNRPVGPTTNATLLTPKGSSLVTYPPSLGLEEASPSKTGLPRPTATTETLLEKAMTHLIAADERIKPIIDRHPDCPLFTPTGLAEQIDPFQSLVRSIISQQVSGAAAKSIKDKFVTLFNTNVNGTHPSHNDTTTIQRFPTATEVSKCDIPSLRTAGLSQRKAEYIQGLAELFANGDLSNDMLLKASDDELFEKLTAVRGLGRWSVEMFACFALKRMDVFSTGDLGVQ